MSYATQADLEKAYSVSEILQLADRDGSGAVDVGVVEAALAKADAEINGYLSVKYALPLASTPQLVTDLACTIARYKLWSNRASEQVKDDYGFAVDQLKRLSSGSMRLTDIAGVEAPAGAAATVRVSTRVRIFDNDSLASY